MHADVVSDEHVRAVLHGIQRPFRQCSQGRALNRIKYGWRTQLVVLGMTHHKPSADKAKAAYGIEHHRDSDTGCHEDLSSCHIMLLSKGELRPLQRFPREQQQEQHYIVTAD